MSREGQLWRDTLAKYGLDRFCLANMTYHHAERHHQFHSVGHSLPGGFFKVLKILPCKTTISTTPIPSEKNVLVSGPTGVKVFRFLVGT